MAIHDFVEGTTERQDFSLLTDGVAPTTDLTGTVAMVLINSAGTVVTITGAMSIVDADAWIVGYTPHATTKDLAHTLAGQLYTTYTFHFAVTQGGVTFFFPRGAAEIFRVRKPGNAPVA